MEARGSRRGRPPLPADKGKRSSFNTRIGSDLKTQLQLAGARAGRSLSEEIEHRLALSLEHQKALDEAFELAYGARAGLVRFLGLAIRDGGGSRALIEALRRVDVPDMTTRPEALAHRLIWGAGYDGRRDPEQAERAAKIREQLGPDMGARVIAAYYKLRADIEEGRVGREEADPAIQEMWAQAIKRATSQETEQ
jgi:hypothetical protein